MLLKKTTQNRWARMQGKLGVKIALSSFIVLFWAAPMLTNTIFKGVPEGRIGSVGFQDGVGGQSECFGADVGEETEEERQSEVDV